MGCVPSKTKPSPAIVEGQIEDRHKSESNLNLRNFQDSSTRVEDSFHGKNDTINKQQSGPITLSVNSGITLQVTPASANTFKVENNFPICVVHNEQFQHWCGICKEPICENCLRTKHLKSNGHAIYDLNASHAQVADELKIEVNRLNKLVDELRTLQKEALEWKQKDVDMAKQFDVAKEKDFKRVADISQEINKAERIILQWSDNENVNRSNTVFIYDAACSVKKCLDRLNSISDDMSCELEGYRISLTYTIKVDQEEQSFSLEEPKSLELQSNKALENFVISDVFRSNYPNLREKINFSGCVTIDLKFEPTFHPNSRATNLKQNTPNEFKRNLRKYLGLVTQFNASYKARQLVKIFPIGLGNVNLITDTAVELALSSDHMSGAMPSFLAYLIGSTSKTTEWHFVADNIPSYLMELCQKYLQTKTPNTANNSEFNWTHYKRLNRFIGELYIYGLLPAALIEYYLDFLLSKTNHFVAQYAECICILILTIGPICERAERRIPLDNYIFQLADRLAKQPNHYIEHLVKQIQELRFNQWNVKECSGISSVSNQQTDLILEYLNSIEMAVISNRNKAYKNRTNAQLLTEPDDWSDLLNACDT